jgi:hypothetical protein
MTDWTPEMPGRDLTAAERKELAGEWVDGWHRGPRTTSVVVTDDKRPDRQWVVTVELSELGGRMEPTVVTVRSLGSPVTREAMKSIPFGGIFGEVRKIDQLGLIRLAEEFDDPELRDLAEEMYGGKRGKRLGDEDLVVVAQAYRRAYELGEPVVAAVAGACFISKSAAAKRIRAARDAGLLEEVER